MRLIFGDNVFCAVLTDDNPNYSEQGELLFGYIKQKHKAFNSAPVIVEVQVYSNEKGAYSLTVRENQIIPFDLDGNPAWVQPLNALNDEYWFGFSETDNAPGEKFPVQKRKSHRTTIKNCYTIPFPGEESTTAIFAWDLKTIRAVQSLLNKKYNHCQLGLFD